MRTILREERRRKNVKDSRTIKGTKMRVSPFPLPRISDVVNREEPLPNSHESARALEGCSLRKGVGVIEISFGETPTAQLQLAPSSSGPLSAAVALSPTHPRDSHTTERERDVSV